MHTRTLYAAVVAIAALLIPVGAAQAAINVANTNDSGPGSLRQALIDAPSGETIVVPPGTYTLTSGELEVDKSLSISGNSPADTIIRSGGAFRVFEVAGSGIDVTISGVTVRDGHEVSPSGAKAGGGILSDSANLTLRNVVVADNRVDVNGEGGDSGGIAEGGGVYGEGVDGSLAIESSLLSGNAATATGGAAGGSGGIARGGGIAHREGTSLTIRNSTFADNLADARGGSGGGGGIAEGGGIFLDLRPTTAGSISGTTVSGNVTDATGSGDGGGIAQGGGLYVESQQPSSAFTNLTIAGNTARSPGAPGGVAEGGGVYFDLENGATVTLTSATVVGNAVDAPGGDAEGGNFDRDPGAKIANSIVSGGQGPPGEENCDDPLESQGFNLESTDQCGFSAAGDQVNKDPLLGPLQNNGGPTATMLPAMNSPAVDQGAAFGLGADQRGVIRPIDFPTIADSAAPGADGSDVGAAELQPPHAAAGSPAPLSKRLTPLLR